MNRGRWTATPDGELVVFLIGMRINRPWKVRRWWPVFTAMPGMVRWLEAHPEAGMLHADLAWRSPISPFLVQYWRSFEDLERFARSAQAPHLEAWRAFNAAIAGNGDVGIWHETYRVASSESLHANMPRSGLGVAGTLRPVGSTAADETAARRIGLRAEDDPPVSGY